MEARGAAVCQAAHCAKAVAAGAISFTLAVPDERFVMRLWLIPMYLAFAFPLLASQAAAAAPPTRMSLDEQAQLQLSLDRGAMLYTYDQAAWHSTDALVEDLTKTETGNVRGWVVTRESGLDKATYFGLDGNTPYRLYSASWDGKAITARDKADPARREPLSAEELRLARALLVARPVASKFARCGPSPFNTVTLPGKTETDPILIYFMTPQTKKDSYPLGGHYRVEVRDGTVVSDRAFTKSCLKLSVLAPVAGGKPKALVVTHLLDTVPTEIHVFHVFASSLPLYVGVTDKRLYGVDVRQGQPRVRLLPGK